MAWQHGRMSRTVLTRVLALTSIASVAAAILIAPAAQASPAPLSVKAPTASLVGTPVSATLFGMSVADVQKGAWPTIPFGSLRLWDNGTTWGQIEKTQNVFDWTALDTAVATAEKNGLHDILMVLAGTPAWASDTPSSGGLAGVLPGAAGMPKDIADWDDWVRQVATRYKGRITAYQPWNEANLTTFSTGTPAKMAELTKHAYDIVKGIDANALLVAPSTGTRLGGPFKRFYPAYLKELAKLNWPVDVFSAHTYPASLGTPVDRAALAQLWQEILKAAGAPPKPLWDTENNFGLAGPGPANPDQDIDDSRAGEWAARAYLDALRLGISRVYWYRWGPNDDLVGIQMNTGSAAAVAVKTLQDWIVGATFNGCRGGVRMKCTFTKAGKPIKVLYAQAGQAVFVTKGFTTVCTLDGACKPITRKSIKASGPILFKN